MYYLYAYVGAKRCIRLNEMISFVQNCCDGTEGVCMYVHMCVCMYVSVCVCDSTTAQTDGWILMKFSANDLTDNCEVRFSRFWKLEIDDVMVVILHFFVAALSWSRFCFDFHQNLTQDRKLYSTVCFLKSARSVGNLRQYGEPRFRKNSKWPPKITFLKHGKWDVYFDWNWPADCEFDNI